jgi:catechol 2,3-dioxygenase-like lactoylglutathione lyase family enzyme
LFSRGLREVVLIVDDVEVSTAFYRDVVGLEHQPQQQPTSDWAWFYVGDSERRQRLGIHKGTLLFENQPAAPGGERWGPVHYAFQVAPDALEDAAEHVRSHGIDVFGPHHFGDAADAYFFYDPDDNLVEFFAYVDA